MQYLKFLKAGKLRTISISRKSPDVFWRIIILKLHKVARKTPVTESYKVFLQGILCTKQLDITPTNNLL